MFFFFSTIFKKEDGLVVLVVAEFRCTSRQVVLRKDRNYKGSLLRNEKKRKSQSCRNRGM
jgi:hypothetical protein